VGLELTANTGSLGGSGTISYEWRRADSAAGTFAGIVGATASTYRLVAADLGKVIRVTVSRADNSGEASSGPTIQVSNAPTGNLSITIGVNNGTITITGSDGTNLISKSGSPDSITLSASAEYSDIKWYIDGDSTVKGTANSITLYASGYEARFHSITFMGKLGGHTYSQIVPFTVTN
jgi:hypothetical protein